ncbi:hypothetical protein FKM82_008576 [Ascaphus truei]
MVQAVHTTPLTPKFPEETSCKKDFLIRSTGMGQEQHCRSLILSSGTPPTFLDYSFIMSSKGLNKSRLCTHIAVRTACIVNFF